MLQERQGIAVDVAPDAAHGGLAAATQRGSDGTQSIERAIAVLRMLATRGRLGWGLTDIAMACGLTKATTHRILARLERERMVHRRPADAQYFVGPLACDLAYSVPGFPGFVQQVQVELTELCRSHRVVTALTLRSGDHFVLIGRVAPLHYSGELHEIGARRPLMTSSAGIAMLLAMPEAERAAIVHSNLALISQNGNKRTDEYRAVLARSLACGYGANFGDLVHGLNSLAIALTDGAGRPFGSLSFADAYHHLPAEQAGYWIMELRRAAPRFVQLAAMVHPRIYVPEQHDIAGVASNSEAQPCTSGAAAWEGISGRAIA